MHYNFPKKARGFTIIELLVVIVIIGLLTTLATTSYLNAQRGARDSARKTKVSSISVAVEAYYRDKQSFPGRAGGTSPGSTYLGITNGCEFYDTITDDYVYAYFPTDIATSSGNAANCSLRPVQTGYDPASFKPFPNWIPGLGDYMNPAPTETRYIGPDGSSGPLYVGTTFFDPLTTSNAQTALIQSIFYRKLKGGYAVYTKLELTDKDATTAGTSYTDEPKFNKAGGTNFSVASGNLYVIRK